MYMALFCRRSHPKKAKRTSLHFCPDPRKNKYVHCFLWPYHQKTTFNLNGRHDNAATFKNRVMGNPRRVYTRRRPSAATWRFFNDIIIEKRFQNDSRSQEAQASKCKTKHDMAIEIKPWKRHQHAKNVKISAFSVPETPPDKLAKKGKFERGALKRKCHFGRLLSLSVLLVLS